MTNEKISKLHLLAQEYHTARGTNPTGVPTGRKLLEEVGELLIALSDWRHFSDEKALMDLKYEIADVAICLDYIAHTHLLQVEECIKAKTEKDRGRGANEPVRS